MANTLDIEEATRQADALLQGAVDQFSKPLLIPSYTPTDTTRSMEVLNRAEVTGGEFASTVDESKKLNTAATEAEKAAIGKEGEAKAAGAIAVGQRSQQEAEGYQYFQRLFGVDMAPNAAIANAAREQQKLRETLATKRDRVNALHATSLFDNPIEYMLNSMELPGAVEDYNTVVDKINSNQTAIDEGIQTARNAGDLNNKGIPTITASMAAANANLAVADAAKQKAQADAKLATTNIDFANKKLAADMALSTATNATTHLEMENERLKYEAMANTIRFADTHALRLESAAKLLYDLADKRSLDVLLQQYDRNIGNPSGTTNRQLFNRLPAAERENIAAIGAGSAGTNPYEALKNIKRVGPQLSPETGRLLSYLSERESVIPRDPLVDPKVNEQRIAKVLKQDIEKEMSNPSQSKIFAEMSPAKMIAANAVPHGSKLEAILLPLSQTDGPVPTNTVISAIVKEYPNPNEAAAVVSAYYQANVSLRNKSLNLGLVGMQPSTKYPVRATSFTFMNTPFGGNTKAYDLTRPEEALKYIIVNQTRDKIIQSPTEGTDTNFIMPVNYNDSGEPQNLTPGEKRRAAERDATLQEQARGAQQRMKAPTKGIDSNIDLGMDRQPPDYREQQDRRKKPVRM